MNKQVSVSIVATYADQLLVKKSKRLNVWSGGLGVEKFGYEPMAYISQQLSVLADITAEQSEWYDTKARDICQFTQCLGVGPGRIIDLRIGMIDDVAEQR